MIYRSFEHHLSVLRDEGKGSDIRAGHLSGKREIDSTMSRWEKGFVMRCAITTSAVMGLASFASAEVSLFFEGMSSHESILYNYAEGVEIDAPGRSPNRYAKAGELRFSSGNEELHLFCIELVEPVSSQSEIYTQQSFTSGNALYEQGQILASLFDQYYQEDGFASSSDAAAFAMLTWEIMSETYSENLSLDETISRFSMTEGAVQFGNTSIAAQTKFDEMKQTLVALDDTSALTIYSNSDYQNFVGYNIPAPGAVALLAIAGFTGMSRRRRS